MTPEEIARLPYRRNVGLMLANPVGQVFVGQRIGFASDAWQMPQGGIDAGEDPHTAALRELEEETGITADLVSFEIETKGWHHYDLPANMIKKLWKGRYRGQEQKWFLLRYHGSDAEVNIATAHPEFSAWKWIDKGDLVESIVPFKRAVYESVLAELGPLL
ncbi:RNA pyrophosphohydrolase [Pseudooceanicola sp.]|uniref:RNA pyrophosphohydrolase n=1 Tax=Pseudooceanicola sp. TaxID=1914328 RepID=UPI002639E8F9|nr:RNA pyrophosphohydrolase [Pseudooceanicola sp.]MDF1854580.1 RNA pyrophosphohydrolase [Pseudooceanicola sp.]